MSLRLVRKSAAQNRQTGYTFKSILLLTVLFRLGLGQTSETSPAGDTPESRHAAYQQLNRQVYARHEDPGSGSLNFSGEKGRSANRHSMT